jgi:hypothetical protein
MARIVGELRERVRQRAAKRCEYCHRPEETGMTFEVDHIRPERHLGNSEFPNLAWACLRCNKMKMTDVASYDQETGELTALFDPRQQNWDAEFDLVDGVLIGKTALGRVTGRLLEMNAPVQVNTRRNLIQLGKWE